MRVYAGKIAIVFLQDDRFPTVVQTVGRGGNGLEKDGPAWGFIWGQRWESEFETTYKGEKGRE